MNAGTISEAVLAGIALLSGAYGCALWWQRRQVLQRTVERQQEELWGYDEMHPGLLVQIRDHIKDRSIHNHPRGPQ